jgi:murein DD-endopeptidase MepM/ murein hydrolase activator NlpD
MDRFVKPLVLLATLIFVAPMLAGCTETPKTQLSWGVDDTLPAHKKVVARKTAPAPRTYVYQDKYYDAPTPTPRPSQYSAPAKPAYAPASYQPSGSVAFAWPVSGRVIADYGSETNGARNDGINIAAPLNTPIRAAASGTVTYSGDELKGYGNLVLIKHADGYVTAYAHADRLLVARGDFVAKGQVIGYAGQTGDVNSPQLHFEIRHDTQPVNPRSYLAKATS